MADSVPSGWYKDPYRQSGLRYWDGRWTDHASHGGGESHPDPVGDAPQMRPPVVLQQAPITARTPAQMRRADITRRLVILACVIAFAVFVTWPVVRALS